MTPLLDDPFKQFIARRSRDLRRISRSTRQEHHLSDVINEAWIMAYGLRDRRGIAIDFLNKSFQDLLISHLYQRLVRYTEQNIRYAARLDHSASGSDQNCNPPALMRTFSSDDGQHPLMIVVEQERTWAQHREMDINHSLAGAYVRLLRLFNNRMRAVADHLLISESYAYRRCAHARLLAVCQKPIPSPMMQETFIPRPWRRFRLQRNPVQLAFDFDDELPF